MKKVWFLHIVCTCLCICTSLFLFTAHSSGQFSYNPYGSHLSIYSMYTPADLKNIWVLSHNPPYGYQQSYYPYGYQQSYYPTPIPGGYPFYSSGLGL